MKESIYNVGSFKLPNVFSSKLDKANTRKERDQSPNSMPSYTTKNPD